MPANTYFGKYRALVVSVDDPQQRGRIRVSCPKILGEATSAWCQPCIPVASDCDGDFCLPDIGEFVWVEFEEGNPDKPIWCGGLFSNNNSPQVNYGDEERIISYKGTRLILKSGELDIVIGETTCTIDETALTTLGTLLGGS